MVFMPVLKVNRGTMIKNKKLYFCNHNNKNGIETKYHFLFIFPISRNFMCTSHLKNVKKYNLRFI